MRSPLGWGLIVLGIAAPLTVGQARATDPPAALAKEGIEKERIDLRVDTSEAERVLAILERRAAGRPVGDAEWRALFATEPYVRLKKREADIAGKFNAPSLVFTDEQFEQFVLSDSLAKIGPRLRRTLDDWRRADLTGAARRILTYLPEGARIRAKVFPVIKPRPNSFVFEADTDPAIFLFLDPDRSRAKFENTVAHELHHIGFSSVASRRDSLLAGLSPSAASALAWVGSFGEGFAMLAAAGGPDVHPHAVSDAQERERWDHDMANFDHDLAAVQKFLLDVAEGRLATEEERNKVGYSFFGEQGPWYTVGWKMAAVIERRYGRPRLVECMLDPRLLLPTYNQAAAELDRAGGEHLATWSPELLAALAAQPVGAPWLELAQPHYSVFYQRGYEEDARLIERWADDAERVMMSKYGVTPAHHRMSIYLHPAPTDHADVDRAVNRCCTRVSDSLATGTIDMLTPSSPALRGAHAISSLGTRKSSPDYSAKVFVSEYIPIAHYEVQGSRAAGGWSYYDAPNWFVQGLQEYDAIFHSTAGNRDSTSRLLSRWAVGHPDVASCCAPDLAIHDDYNGGASFVAFLAVQFGEGIHGRLLRSTAPTFFDALTSETRPYSRAQLLALYQEWLRHGAPTDAKQ